MSELTSFIQIYLVIGAIYGVYIMVTTKASIWALPINILGGPIALLLVLWDTFKRALKIKR